MHYLIPALLLCGCLSERSVDADAHACAACAPCQRCVGIVDGRAQCRAERRARQVCTGDGGIHWFDSCGSQGELALVCRNGGRCETAPDGLARCVCRWPFTGDDCSCRRQGDAAACADSPTKSDPAP